MCRCELPTTAGSESRKGAAEFPEKADRFEKERVGVAVSGFSFRCRVRLLCAGAIGTGRFETFGQQTQIWSLLAQVVLASDLEAGSSS
jgi:hypothetical protein